MSSKRAIRRKQCEGKVRHETSSAAKAALYSLRRSGKIGRYRMNIYKCQFCGGYHIGHAIHQKLLEP